MPKEVNLLPNLRVDIPDFRQQTAGLSLGGHKHLAERFFMDNSPVAIEGFRVEVDLPLTVTVHNGEAFNRDGQALNNEEDLDASRSTTFPADGVYFLEVEYTQGASDVDSRGFWDPSYNNGADPSGDVRPKGREFPDNVATRLTPDWRIVTPVSTTAFAVDLNANATQIPVAQVVVTGGVITGVTTVKLTSVLRAEVTPVSTTVQVVDSREMPAIPFQLILSPGEANVETVSITANDQENHVLTLGSSPVGTHPVGRRVQATGAAALDYIPEGGYDPSPTVTSDARRRFFQANSEQGFLHGLDTGGIGDERSDQQVHNLKRYVDFLAAQIREMKFGAPQTVQLGQKAPPSANLDTLNRYFDPSGGILPSRGVTATMGNGVTSWGDFNTSQYGSATAAFTAAIAFIDGLGGGNLFVKRGIYDIDTTVSALSDIHIMGEGFNVSILRNTANNRVFELFTTNTLRLSNISVIKGPGAISDIVLELSGNGSLMAENARLSRVDGLVRSGTFLDCLFTGSDIAWSANLFGTSFHSCVFETNGTSPTDRCVYTAYTDTTSFNDCSFTDLGGSADYLFTLNEVTIGSVVKVSIDNSTFTPAGENGSILIVEGGGITVKNTSFEGAGNQVQLDTCSTVTLEGLRGSISDNNIHAIHLTVPTNVKVAHCTMSQTATDAAKTCVGVYIEGIPSNVQILDNRFTKFDIHVSSTGMNDSKVCRNYFEGSANQGRKGIVFRDGAGPNPVFRTVITENTFKGLTDPNSPVLAGIVTENLVSLDLVTIANNIFSNIGGGTGGARSVGVAIDLQDVAGVTNSSITGNHIQTVNGPTVAVGIRVKTGIRLDLSGNTIQSVATTATPGTWGGIRLENCRSTTVTHNNIETLGSNTNPIGVQQGAIRAIATTQMSGLVISNNTIKGLVTQALAYAISVHEGYSDVTVTGNTCLMNEALSRGIYVVDSDSGADSPQTTRAVISGNVVSGLCVDSIMYEAQRAVVGVGRQVSISGNVVSDAASIGIHVLGESTAARLRGVSITGNTVYVTAAASIGIHMQNLHGFTCTGNQVTNTSIGALAHGIKGEDCIRGTCSGNMVENYDYANNTSSAIDFGVGSVRIAITGNMVWFGTSCPGNSPGEEVNSYGIRIRNNMYVTGNHVIRQLCHALSTGGCIYNAETSATAITYTTAFSAIFDETAGLLTDPPLAPIDSNNDTDAFIGLNYRVLFGS